VNIFRDSWVSTSRENAGEFSKFEILLNRISATMIKGDQDDDKADMRQVDGANCPILGPAMGWPACKKVLIRWQRQCTIDKKLQAGHIISRGFSRHAAFTEMAELMGQTELQKATGFQYLIDEMDNSNRDGDTSAQMRRTQEFHQTIRKDTEDIEVFVRRWRLRLQEVNEDSPTESYKRIAAQQQDGSTRDEQHLAMLLLISAARLSTEQIQTLSGFIDFRIKYTTVDDVVRVFERLFYKKQGLTRGVKVSGAYVSDVWGDGEWDEGDVHNAWQEENDPDEPQWEYANTPWDEDHQSHWLWDDDLDDGGAWVEYLDEEAAWVDSGSFLAVGQCARCGKHGHWARECKSKDGKPKGKGKGKSMGGFYKGSSGKSRGKGKGKGRGKSSGKSGSFGYGKGGGKSKGKGFRRSFFGTGYYEEDAEEPTTAKVGTVFAHNFYASEDALQQFSDTDPEDIVDVFSECGKEDAEDTHQHNATEQTEQVATVNMIRWGQKEKRGRSESVESTGPKAKAKSLSKGKGKGRSGAPEADATKKTKVVTREPAQLQRSESPMKNRLRFEQQSAATR